MKIVKDNSKEQLQELYDLLKQNTWDVTYEPISAERPYDTLIVKIYAEVGGKNIYWPAELSFLPGLEEDIKDAMIMQCFVPMVVEIPASLNDALAVMINRINTKLPLVGFGLLESHSLIYFKHNLLLPNGEQKITGQIMQQTLSMISYLLYNFFEAFVDVATSKKTVQEAMKTMPFSRVYA
ncbi:MAG: hypothetical protein V4539_03815 [Bacteroidota bacterium]